MAVKSLGKAFQAFSDEGQKFLDRVLNRDAPEVSFEDEYYDVPVPAKAKEQGYSEQKFTHVGPKGLMEYDLDAERANAGLSPEGIYAGFKDPDKAKKYADRLREKGIDPEEYELTTTGRSVFVLGADKPNEKMVEAFDYVLRNKVPNAGEDYYQGKIDTFRKSGAMDIDMSRKNKSDVFRYGGAEALLDGEDFVFLKPEQVREVGADFEKSKIGQSGLFKTLAPTAVALGLVSTPEEAEAAYIPLKAFAEGSPAAKALFERAKKRIDEGADTSPNGELYQEMGVYRSEDGDFKVDVAELRARNQEQMTAIGTFAKDLDFYLKSDKARTKKFEFPITRYITEDSPIFEYFPELKDSNVKIAPRSTDPDNSYSSYGFYRAKGKDGKPEIVITIPKQLNLNPDSGMERMTGKGFQAEDKMYWDEVFGAFSTLVHEFQHHIQSVKKSANTGYNRRSVDKETVSGLRSQYEEAVQRLKELEPGDPGYETYRRLADNFEEIAYDSLGVEMKKEFKEASPEGRADLTIGALDAFKSGIIGKDGMVPHGIYIRELGEAEARSSGLKALLPEGEQRKAVGVFYPKNYINKKGYVSQPSDVDIDDQLKNEFVLIRATPSYEALDRHGDLYGLSEVDFSGAKDPKIVADAKNKDKGTGAAAVVGAGTAAGLASRPSEAFVSEIGERTGLFEDGSPTASLFDVEGVSDELGISNTFLLDLLVPRTKPYDLISSIPGVGEAMMATDAIDSSFGDYLRGEGTEAGQRIRAEADKDNIEMRQGGGLETEAGKQMAKEKFQLDERKADLDNDGKLSSYEKARGEAVQRAMGEGKETKMAMGGMMGDPFAPFQVVMGIDEDSGNEIPAGSKPEEVRDDIPAMLSEGEYVVPADVVRYHGLKTFEALRSEAKCALGLMAQHDRISMVDDETKEPVEYDIEEKDAPEVEEAEVKVVEAAEGTDVQASPVASAFYQLRYITDPVTGETRMAYVDPTTGLEVTEETYDPAKANRYSIENILSREVSPKEEAEEEEKEEPKEAESTLGTEEVFPRRSDEDGGPAGQRMTRDLGNNYGYTTEGIGSKLGPFGGPLAFADNVNNAAAVSQARQNLGLDGLGFLDELGAGFTGQYNNGFVGEIQVGGINYGVTLGDTGEDYGPLGSRVDKVISAKEADALNFTVGQDSPFDAMETSNEPVTTSTTPIETADYGYDYGDGDKSFGIEGADYQADRSFGIEGEGYGATSDSGFTDDYGYDYGTGYGDAEKEDSFGSVSTDQDDVDRERNESMGLNKGGYATRKNKPRVAMMKY